MAEHALTWLNMRAHAFRIIAEHCGKWWKMGKHVHQNILKHSGICAPKHRRTYQKNYSATLQKLADYGETCLSDTRGIWQTMGSVTWTEHVF